MKIVTLLIRLPEKLKKQLKRIADNEAESMNTTVKSAIKEFINKRKS